MKKILLGFILSIAAASFVSCDMNDPNDGKFGDASDPKGGWVDFDTELKSLEDRDTVFTDAACRQIRIPIQITSPINTEGVEVAYTIEDLSGESAADLEGTAVIAAGSRDGYLIFTNPEILTSTSRFRVTLVSTNRENVTAEVIREERPSVTVTIIPSSLAGSYEVNEVSEEGTFDYTVDVTQSSSDSMKYIISNLYGVNPGSQTTIFVNPDGTLSFPAHADNFLTVYQGNSLYVEGISGTYDICEGTITMSFNLRRGPGANAPSMGPYNVTFTAQ